jgi:hypothetical protein
MAKFIAFAVDMSGMPEARYDLIADESEAAAQEARQYLERHRIIEVWSTDHRRVARSSGRPTSRTIAADARNRRACWPTSLAPL